MYNLYYLLIFSDISYLMGSSHKSSACIFLLVTAASWTSGHCSWRSKICSRHLKTSAIGVLVPRESAALLGRCRASKSRRSCARSSSTWAIIENIVVKSALYKQFEDSSATQNVDCLTVTPHQKVIVYYDCFILKLCPVGWQFAQMQSDICSNISLAIYLYTMTRLLL